MITTLIFLGFIILGTLCIAPWEKLWPYCDFFSILGSICLAFGIVGSIVCSLFIITTHAMTDKSIHDNQIEHDALVAQVDAINTDYEDVSTTQVIANVAKWNKFVYNNRYWSENKWTNWFYSKKVVDDLKYIDMEEVE